MANVTNPVTGAVGTQRQFSSQPQGVYQRRLNGVNFVSGSGGTDLDAQALAGAFGLMSNALNNEGVEMDKRERKAADFAEKLAYQDPTAIKGMNTIEFLNQHSDFDLASNRYAKAVVSRVRGEVIAGEAKSKWESLQKNKPLPETSEEYVADYENFMSDAYKDNVNGADNANAFKHGMYSNHAKDVLTVGNSYNTQKAEKLYQETAQTAVAKLDKVASNALYLSPEDVVKGFTDTVDMFKVSGLINNEPLMNKIINNGIIEVAKEGGSPEQIEKLKATVYGKDKDGKDITYGDKFDCWQDIQAIVGVRGASLRQNSISKYLDMFKGLDTDELIDAQIAKIRNDPQARYAIEAVLNEAPRLKYEAKLRRETKARADAQNTQNVANIGSMKQGFLAGMEAYLAGQDHDKFGRATNALQYQKFDKNGVATWTKMSEADITTLMPAYLNQIYNDKEADAETRAGRLVSALSHPSLKFYASTMASQATRMLNNLDLSKLAKDDGGNYVLPPALKTLIDARRTRGGDFEVAFGDSNTTEIDALNDLSDAFGSEKTGLEMYMKAQENIKNDDFMKPFETQVRMAEFDFNKIPDCFGRAGDVTEQTRQEITAKCKGRLRYVLATNSCNFDDSLKLIQGTLSKNYFAYKGAMLPKGLAQGTPSALANGIDYWIEDGHKAKSGFVKGSSVIVRWDSKRSQIVISGGGVSDSVYTISDIKNQVAYVAENISKGKNVHATDKTSKDFGNPGLNTDATPEDAMYGIHTDKDELKEDGEYDWNEGGNKLKDAKDFVLEKKKQFEDWMVSQGENPAYKRNQGRG